MTHLYAPARRFATLAVSSTLVVLGGCLSTLVGCSPNDASDQNAQENSLHRRGDASTANSADADASTCSPSASSTTILGNAVPSNPSDPDSNPVEVGMKFQATETATITGIRFYKGAGNTGTHVGNLYARDGRLLASSTFTNETESGWQTVLFNEPVTISANITYVASYYAPAGHYAGDIRGMASQIDDPTATVHTMADGADGGNGVYRYGVGGGFPTSTYQATNYYVDILAAVLVTSAACTTDSGTAPDTSAPDAMSSDAGGDAIATGVDATSPPNDAGGAPPPTDCTVTPCHYVRSGATGSKDGSDWSNAYPSLPATLVRGHTYFIAGGSYAGGTFDTPVSGTSIISITGATTANHGTDAGWNNSYSVESTQATWTSGVTLSTSYWVFDGSAGPTWSRIPSQYGFAFSPTTYPILVSAVNEATTNVIISHISATAPTGDTEKLFVSTYSLKPTGNITISHSYLNGWQNAYMASSDGLTMDNWVFEYNICLNGFSSPAHHGEWLNNNYGYMTNQVTRFNWFEGQQNGTGVIVANNNDNVDAKVYGNVFKDIAEGNGIITGTSAGNLASPEVYNNTFVNSVSGGWIGGNTTGTPLVYNNVLYNMDASSAVNTDYNAYFSTTNTPTEAHGQIGAGSPFVNEPGNDLRLLSGTAAGTPLSSPYNTDVLGSIRGSDGTWDRGAYEYRGP